MARRRRTKAELHAAKSLPEPDMRWCSGCQAERPKEEFARCERYGRQRLCRTHRAEYMRNYRAARPGAETEKYRTDPEFAKRVRARKRIGMRLRRGTLQAQPCEGCGNPDAQSHHIDYDEPLKIRWLCRKCHGAEHYPKAQP